MARPVLVLLTAVILFFSQISGTEKKNAELKNPSAVVRNEINVCLQDNLIESTLPFKQKNTAEASFAGLVFNTLFEADTDGNLLPGLCRKWTLSQNKKSVTLFLHQKIRFHNGRLLTADDVIFTLEELLKNTGRRFPELLLIKGADRFLNLRTPHISGLQKKGPHKLQITFSGNYLPVIALLSNPASSVVPRDYNQTSLRDFAASPMGTGPFIFTGRQQVTVKHQPFLRYHFTRNPHYLNSAGKLQHLNIFFPEELPLASTLYFFDIFLISREIMFNSPTAGQERRIVNSGYRKTMVLAVNPTAVRGISGRVIPSSLLFGIDRSKLISQSMLSHNALPACSLIPKKSFLYNPDYRLNRSEIENIRSVPDSTVHSFRITCQPWQKKLAVHLKKQLAEFRIKVDVSILEKHKYVKKLSAPVKESFLVECFPDHPHPFAQFKKLYLPAGENNVFHLSRESFRQLTRQLLSADPKKQVEIVSKLNGLAHKNPDYIPLFYFAEKYIIKKRIGYLRFNFFGVIDYNSLEVKDE